MRKRQGTIRGEQGLFPKITVICHLQNLEYNEPTKPTYYNKVSFANRCDDIQGSTVKSLIQYQPVTR